MDKLRRDCSLISPFPVLLLLVAALTASCGHTAHADRIAEPVLVRNLQQPGTFEVDNTGPAIQLWSQVKLQRFQNGQWQEEQGTNLFLAESCGWNQQPVCQTLPQGAKLHPFPWNGLSCGGQCPMVCRANDFLGPGQFRFVVTTCDRKRSFYGPAFTLPDYDHSELKKKEG